MIKAFKHESSNSAIGLNLRPGCLHLPSMIYFLSGSTR